MGVYKALRSAFIPALASWPWGCHTCVFGITSCIHWHVWFKLTCHRITDFIMLGGGMILHSITDLYCNVGEGTGKLPATRIAQQLQVAGKSFNQCSHHALPLLQAWRNWPKRWPSEHTQRVEMSTYNKNCNIFEIPCKKKFQRMISWDHFGVPLFQCTWYILKLFVSMTKHSSNIDVHASKILQKKKFLAHGIWPWLLVIASTLMLLDSGKALRSYCRCDLCGRWFQWSHRSIQRSMAWDFNAASRSTKKQVWQ